MSGTIEGISKEIKNEHLSTKLGDMEAVATAPSQSETKQSGQQEIKFYHQAALNFMKTLKKDYKRLAEIYNSCLMMELERERKNKDEIRKMKKIYHQMQNEKIIVKRQKWCRYCESEATYLSSDGNKFYCSQECEQKQKEFVNAIESAFKI